MFNALLRLYPASFRQEYGAEMRADFQQRSKNSSGMSGRLALWISLVFDTLFNATAVHWDILRQDLRYTWRSLRRSPGFALMAVLVIALGIGATTAAFSVTDYVLLRPLPYRNPDRLVKLWENLPNYSRIELSPANFRDWKRASHSFEAMGSFHEDSTNLVGQGNPERLEGTATDSELLPMLGVQPLLGRLFAPEDDRAGAAGTVILSHSLWQNIFGGDQRVVGRKVIFNDEPYTVIGVMPAAFKFPNRETEY